MSRFVLLLAQLLVVLLLCSTVNTSPNGPPTDAPGPPAVNSPEACTCASNAACDNATAVCTGSLCGNDGDVFTCDRNNLSLVVIASPLATIEGASLLLTCIVNLTPDDITVYWRDPEGSSISGEGTKYEISAESGAVYDLVINNSSYEDSGTYTCVAVLNEPTTRLSSVTEQVNITVYALGRIFSSPPTTIRIVAGDQLDLTCKAFFGLTTPSLEWVLPSQAVERTAQITSQEEYFQGTELISSRSLVVTNVSSIHNGTYRCQAMVDKAVTDTREIHVFIVDNPIIDNLLLSDVSTEGFTLTWEMVFAGNDNVTCALCVNGLRYTLCGVGSTYIVTGLSSYTFYNISLVCENYAGESNELVIKNQRTLPTAPDMIPDVALYEGRDAITTTSVRIAVPTVSDRNGPISCYEFAVIDSPSSRISHPDEDFISMVGAAEAIDNEEPYAALVLGSIRDISYITIGGNETTLSECSIRGGDVILRRSISPNLITSLSAKNVPLEGSTNYAIFMRVYTGLDDGSVDFRSSNYLMITTSAADSGTSGFPFLIIIIIILAVVLVVLALLFTTGCIIKRWKSQKTETITAGDADDVYINDGYTPSAYLSLPNYYAAQEEVASYHPLRTSGQNQDTLKDDTDISRNSGYLTMKPSAQNSIPGLSDDYQDASSSERVRQPKPPVELAFGLGEGPAANSTRSTGSDEEKLNLKQKGWDIADVKQEQDGNGDGSHLASGHGGTVSSHNVRDVVPIAGTKDTSSDNMKNSMITGELVGEGLSEDGSAEVPPGDDWHPLDSVNLHPSDDPSEVQEDSTLSSTMGSDGSVVHRYYDGKGDYEVIPHRTGDTSSSGYSRGVYNKWRSPVPFKVSELPSYVEDGKQNGAQNFKREFSILPQSQQEPWTVASKPENIQKNAFQNVLPYDHSRVKLTKLPDDPFSDYYNASFITVMLGLSNGLPQSGSVQQDIFYSSPRSHQEYRRRLLEDDLAGEGGSHCHGNQTARRR